MRRAREKLAETADRRGANDTGFHQNVMHGMRVPAAGFPPSPSSVHLRGIGRCPWEVGSTTGLFFFFSRFEGIPSYPGLFLLAPGPWESLSPLSRLRQHWESLSPLSRLRLHGAAPEHQCVRLLPNHATQACARSACVGDSLSL